jgi:hypothetical protein
MAGQRFLGYKTKEGFTVYYPADIPQDKAAADIQRRRASGTLQPEPDPTGTRGPDVAGGLGELTSRGGEPTYTPGGSLEINLQPTPTRTQFEEAPAQPSSYEEAQSGPPIGVLTGNAQPKLAGNDLAAGRLVEGMQGVGFDFGDEALGAGAATLDTLTGSEPGRPIGAGPAPGQQPQTWTSKYDYYRDRARDLDARMLSERPAESYGARIGGAMATGIATLPKLSLAAIRRVAPEMAERLAAKKIAPKVAAGGAMTTEAVATLGDKMVDGAVQGMMGGGLAGFGAGGSSDPESDLIDSTAERLGGAGLGALTGAGLGAVIPPAASTIAAGGRWLGTTIAPGLFNPEKQAARVFASGIGDDLAVSPQMGPNAPGPAAQMAGPGGNAINDLTFSDVSPNARDMLGSVARAGGQGGKRAKDFLESRQLGDPMQGEAGGGQWTQSLRHIREAVSAANTHDLIRSISETLSRTAKPLYDKARAWPSPNSPEAAELLRNPRIKAAIKEGIQVAKDFGELPANFKVPNAEHPDATVPIQVWHVAKMGLDVMIERAAKKSGMKAASIKALQGRLLDMLDTATGGHPGQPGDYTIARNTYAGIAKLREAVQTGADIFKGSLQDVRSHIAKLSGPERQLYIAGVAQALEQKVVGKVIGGDSARIFFNTPDVQMRLGAAFTPQQYKEFIGRMVAESNKFKSFMELGNSATAERTAKDAALEETITNGGTAESIVAAARGGPNGLYHALTGWLGRTLATNKPGGLHDAVRNELSKMLTETDPKKQQVYADMIFAAANRVIGRQRAGRLVRQGMQSAGRGAVSAYGADVNPDMSRVPPKGFKQHSDGAWYGKNPKVPGGYLKWTPDKR